MRQRTIADPCSMILEFSSKHSQVMDSIKQVCNNYDVNWSLTQLTNVGSLKAPSSSKQDIWYTAVSTGPSNPEFSMLSSLWYTSRAAASYESPVCPSKNANKFVSLRSRTSFTSSSSLVGGIAKSRGLLVHSRTPCSYKGSNAYEVPDF
jgi:hypothetical protein